MNEHSQCDPFFFKGQMAARYRERMSMGFALANFKKGDSDSSILDPTNNLSPTNGDEAEPIQRVTRAADHTRKGNETRGKSSRNINTGHLYPSRSRSSLDEHQICWSKPTMKELITKFETRSLTSEQFQNSMTSDDERERLAREIWESSGSKVVVELDPAVITCSSLSDVGDSKSSTSLSRPPRAKTSKATLSLNSETNLDKQEIYLAINKPASKTVTRMAADRSFQNASNSHRGVDNQSLCNKRAPDSEAGDAEAKSGTKLSENNVENILQGIATVIDSVDNQEDSSLPLRVNLKDVAIRKKNNSANKYIVHRKDWAKRLPSWQKDTGISTNTNSSQDIQAHYSTGVPKSDGHNNTFASRRDISSGTSDRVDSPSAQIRQNMRSASRQSVKTDDSKGKVSDEKLKTKAMDRYLQFTKSSNTPQQNTIFTDVKLLEKSDQRRAQRPPTPHRLLHLRKGNSIVSRNSLHQIRENSQIASTQVDSESKPIIDGDAKPGHLSRRGHRWRFFPGKDRKELLIDPSGGDFFLNVPISTSNSIDSSVCEYPNNLSPTSRIGQTKSEISDARFSRPTFTNKQMSKWAYLTGRRGGSIKSGDKGSQNRPHSAHAHNQIEKKISKLQFNSLSRGQSLCTSSNPESLNVVKVSSILGKSPKSAISLNPVGPLEFPNPLNHSAEKENKARPHKFDTSEVGSVILTEDELADNELVPIHLREKKMSDSSCHISVAPSSSNESCSRQAVTHLSRLTGQHQVKKSFRSSGEKRPPAVIDKMEPLFFDSPDSVNIPKHSLLSLETKQAKTNPLATHERKRPSEQTKHAALHGKGRSANTPTKCFSRETSFDDSSNHKNLQMFNTRCSNAPLSSHTKLSRTTDSSTLSKKESNTVKDSLSIPLNVIPKERRAHGTSRDTRERKYLEDASIFSELHKTESLQAAGEGTSEKGFSNFQHRSHDQQRESPSKKSTRQLNNGQNLGIFSENSVRESLKERKSGGNVDVDAIRNVQYEQGNEFNLFHFGQNDGKKEDYSDVEGKMEKAMALSPLKKKRKAEQPKKSGKKKKKADTTESESIWNRSQSITVPITDSKLSPIKDEFSPMSDKSPQMKTPKKTPSLSRGMELPIIPKSTYELHYRPTGRSQIPLLIVNSPTPRRRLDRLIQYRRWREAMLDCLRPSKLPLSDSFRKTLDSAVMEEWAMHCWQPSRDMYVDSQGVWWSASYQEIESPGGVPESLLGDGRLLSKEWLLDITSRLPYMKVGPVRLIHASCAFFALICLTVGHMGVRLYHCGGDDYEYYCPDDDLECLTEMFSHNIR